MEILTRVPGFLENVMHLVARSEPALSPESRPLVRLLSVGLLLGCLPLVVLGAEVRPWTVMESSSDHLVVRMNPVGPLRLEPAAQGETQQVSLEGFGWTEERGAPRLPRLILRVALPPHSEPTLTLRPFQRLPVPGIRPSPVPTRDVLGLPADGSPLVEGRHFRLVLRPSAEVYQGETLYPPAPVRLGRRGALRRQEFVELVYTPLAYDPSSGSLVRFQQVVVEIEFGRPQGREASTILAPGPGWSAVYRGAFINSGVLEGTGRKTAATALESAVVEATSSTAMLKIQLDAEALVRIPCSDLSDLAGTDPANWTLMNRGVEQPMLVQPGGGDPACDFVEFWGVARDEENMVFEVDLTPAPPLYRDTDVGGTNFYLLSVGVGPGARVATVAAHPDAMAPLPAEADFVHTEHFEEESLFVPLAGEDAWYWLPSISALASDTRVMSLDLPGLSGASFSANVRVAVRGMTSLSAVPDDHEVSFLLNGQVLPGLLFDGESVAILDTTVAQDTVLTHPSSLSLTAETVLDGGDPVPNEVVPDYVEITYRREFVAVDGTLLFSFADGDHGFQVSGLQDMDVRVYDLSATVGGSSVVEPVLLTGVQVSGSGGCGGVNGCTAAFEIHPTGQATRRLLVTSGGVSVTPSSCVPGSVTPPCLQLDEPSDLRNPANGAGYLLITHRDLVDRTPGSSFEQFLAHRAAGGLPVAVVYVDDIYDEFSDSLPGPEPIRDFLSYAFHSWTGWDADGDANPDPPSYVLFLGDATFDVRQRFTYDGSIQDWFNKTPTTIFYQNAGIILSWFGSDHWFAAVSGGDLVPDFLVGRLTTRSMAETETILSKVVAYETAPPGGTWTSEVLLVSGKGKRTEETEEFENIILNLEADFIAPPFSSNRLLYTADFGGSDAAAMNQAIVDGIDAGAALMNVVSHGNFTQWGLAPGIYHDSDVALQTNAGRLPFVVIENCLSGGFAWHVGPGMGEALTLAAIDGAVGVFAPAGLSSTLVGEPMVREIYEAVFGRDKIRIAGTLAAVGLSELFRNGHTLDVMAYELLGDPALQLLLPAPAPPGDLSAIEDNGVVHLTWTVSDDVVAGYSVYRSLDPAQPYTRITPSPVPGSAYDDGDVVNALTYYYAVVAVDAQGFESAWSNQNSDCGIPGPDCVQATPINLLPPSKPSGVAAESQGAPDKVRLLWNTNPEPDVQLYRVRWGLSSGSYSGSLQVNGNVTEATVPGLLTGSTYFFAVEAENTSSLVSPLSDEVSAVPRLIMGIRPPATVAGLLVEVALEDATSLDLSWNPVTSDIYGDSSSVVSYRLFRGTAPGFVPDLDLPLATVGAPLTTYRDGGAAVTPTDYYYLVLAVDSQGFTSGVAQDLPTGVLDLQVSLQPDDVSSDLSWSAVTQTVSGMPTTVVAYQVHGAATVLPRQSVSPATLLGTVSGTSFSHVPPGPEYYYTVVAVDHRGALSPF